MTDLALGIDVGGTKIAAALVAFPAASIQERQRRPSAPERGGAAVFDDALTMASELCEEARASGNAVTSIGLGMCELVDNDGRIVSAATIDWRDLDVRTRLSALAPTTIEADVRAAALAEDRYGAGKPFEHFVYVTVGTGISAAWVKDGTPWTGAHGAAGTVASSPMLQADAADPLGSTLEELAGGPGLVARYNRVANAETTSADQVLAAAASGDAIAAEVVRAGAVGLGDLLGTLANMLDPEAIVVGGGLGSASGDYWSLAVESARQQIWHLPSRTLPILVAGCGPDAGLIGAAAAGRSTAHENNPAGTR